MSSDLLDWSGRTCAILASGPSLTAEQVSAVRGLKMTALNATYKLAPEADVLYAGDFMFWKTYHADARKASKSQFWTQDSMSHERYGVKWVRGINREGLGHDVVHQNGNSGFQAINLAYLFGCRRILLLGFDMKLGPRDEKHWHADHPSHLMQAQQFGEWIHKSQKLADGLKAAGCEVINCSRETALMCWPRSTIEKELML